MSRPLPAALDLSGRPVLVTGAASGIGRATAACLAELGADLTLADLADLAPVREALAATGARVRVEQGDLRDAAFCARLVEAAPWFAFANVAGVFQGLPGQSPEEAFDFVMHVNVRAPVQLAAGIVAGMAARGEGYVALVGSAAGRNGGASQEASLAYAAYAASKGGVHTLARWLSRRAVGRGVMVNAVAPGVVRTPLFEAVSRSIRFDPAALPAGRAAEPEELGWPIALLCTRAASYTSGAVLDVNGGSFVG
ncbi:SDR family NAD(P)-dependent oxidoreductase [Albimonas pacifica]|uniref:3-oxoacyl-[acyl-carrier protein] reductase n=1 Tax=Albimonas pacifica TaxID=1114924 RepID=A0A1I3BXV5_9RHOB|nr:SDR family oxidoreductase [Albimonas pacifica]SFH67188.1 3-oxoacyl-[acyl-carrier protein] reductase [Albimonas pacifica]